MSPCIGRRQRERKSGWCERSVARSQERFTSDDSSLKAVFVSDLLEVGLLLQNSRKTAVCDCVVQFPLNGET